MNKLQRYNVTVVRVYCRATLVTCAHSFAPVCLCVACVRACLRVCVFMHACVCVCVYVCAVLQQIMIFGYPMRRKPASNAPPVTVSL